MTNFEPILTLSVDNLNERRNQLQTELNKVVELQVTTGLRDSIGKILIKAGVTNATRLTWDFYPESDDEGGSTWYTTDLSLLDDKGNYIETEGISFEAPSWDGKSTYDYDLDDAIQEEMYEYKDDLYEQDITEIEL